MREQEERGQCPVGLGKWGRPSRGPGDMVANGKERERVTQWQGEGVSWVAGGERSQDKAEINWIKTGRRMENKRSLA